MERWKPVRGYENLYEVSNLGRVKSLHWNKSRILSMGGNPKEYRNVKLFKEGRFKFFKVARLVLEAFRLISTKMMINHKDGNKLNDSLENLEWVTPKENCLHAVRTGLLKPKQGELNGMSKLNKHQVLKIRDLFKKGYKQSEIAEMFDVCRGTIFTIVHKVNWRHI